MALCQYRQDFTLRVGAYRRTAQPDPRIGANVEMAKAQVRRGAADEALKQFLFPRRNITADSAMRCDCAAAKASTENPIERRFTR